MTFLSSLESLFECLPRKYDILWECQIFVGVPFVLILTFEVSRLEAAEICLHF